MTHSDPHVQLLLDERAISHTVQSYSRAMSHGWEEEFLEFWMETAAITFRWVGANRDPAQPLPDIVIEGREAIREFLRQPAQPPGVYRRNVQLNPSIAIDGDAATSETSFVVLRESDTGPYISSFGRYLDTLVRCPDGAWRIASRLGEVDNHTPI
jgi:hypothetical protein